MTNRAPCRATQDRTLPWQICWLSDISRENVDLYTIDCAYYCSFSPYIVVLHGKYRRAECLKAARACRKAGLNVLNMFSLDLNSGTMRVIYDAVDLEEKLDSMECEERTDEEKEEQHQIDLDNSRPGTTL